MAAYPIEEPRETSRFLRDASASTRTSPPSTVSPIGTLVPDRSRTRAAPASTARADAPAAARAPDATRAPRPGCRARTGRRRDRRAPPRPSSTAHVRPALERTAQNVGIGFVPSMCSIRKSERHEPRSPPSTVEQAPAVRSADGGHPPRRRSSARDRCSGRARGAGSSPASTRRRPSAPRAGRGSTPRTAPPSSVHRCSRAGSPLSEVNTIGVFSSRPAASRASSTRPSARSTPRGDRYWSVRKASIAASCEAVNRGSSRTQAGLSETSASSNEGGRAGGRSANASLVARGRDRGFVRRRRRELRGTAARSCPGRTRPPRPQAPRSNGPPDRARTRGGPHRSSGCSPPAPNARTPPTGPNLAGRSRSPPACWYPSMSCRTAPSGSPRRAATSRASIQSWNPLEPTERRDFVGRRGGCGSSCRSGCSARLGQQSGFTTNASGNVTPRPASRSDRIGIAHRVSQRWSSVTIRTMSGGAPVSKPTLVRARPRPGRRLSPAPRAGSPRGRPRRRASRAPVRLERRGEAARRRPGTRARR